MMMPANRLNGVAKNGCQVFKRIALLRFVVVLVALLTIGLLPGIVAGQDGSEEPTVVAEARFTVEDPPSAPLEAHQLVLDFAPGAVAALHQHGGPGFITMLTGELSLIADGVERTYRAGDDFIEVPESVYEGTNLTADPASLMVTYLVPAGHPVTTYITSGASAPAAPGPQVVTQTMFEIPDSPDDYEIVHHVIDYAPGAWSGDIDNAGATFITVVHGELDVRDPDGEDGAYAAGDTRIEAVGGPYERGNDGAETARIVATTIVPLEDDAMWGRFGQLGMIAGAACIGLIVGGFVLRRRRVV